MPKFATKTHTPLQRAPIVTTGPARTYEGGLGAVRDPKGELFMLAISNLVSETTFYEGAKKRDQRFADLVRHVTGDEPEWVAALVPYLRSTLNLRSVAVVMACEYVAAGGPNGRGVIAAACQRADEPAEVLAYWQAVYGRKLPMPVKRGLADAARRLYTERNTLRYDGTERPIRFADVIELSHPAPRAPWQNRLFKQLIDRRHGRGQEIPTELRTLTADATLRALPEDQRRAVLVATSAGADGLRIDDGPIVPTLSEADWSWERLAGWLPGGMDAQAWEAVIPNMGYMALLRNLRNFDQADISDVAVKLVIDKLTDPAEVVRSRQLPYRFYSAWRELQSLRWAYPLEQALEMSLSNVPRLDGRTLVVLDLSSSMSSRVSARSQRANYEIASVFGVALAQRAESADIIGYSDMGRVIGLDHHHPLLRMVDGIGSLVGGATYTGSALLAGYDGHDRVVILTDGEAHDDVGYAMDRCVTRSSKPPTFYTFNIGGFRPTHAELGKGRYEIGGLSDAGFTLLSVLEAGRDGEWPHLAQAQ